jgi:hypothetical protein
MLSPLPRRSGWVHGLLASPTVSAFPDMAVGSARALSFSRLIRRSLELRPAHSRCHRISWHASPKASTVSLPPQLLRLLPAGAVAGWDSHPLGKRRLSTAHTKSGREYQLYRLVYEAIHLTTFNELRGQYDVEPQFYVDSVKTPPGNRTEAQAGVMNVFNAPIGVVQQGHHSSAQVIIEPADTVALRDALQVLTRTIQGSAAMSAETKASNQEIISDLESAIK